jgi:hypothetical protein
MPDTASYLYLGLAVVVVIMGGYSLSLFLRFRGVEQDLQVIDQLKDE